MVKRRKQCLLEQIQSHRFQDWDHSQDPQSHSYNAEWPSQMPFFSHNLDSRNPKQTGMLAKRAAGYCVSSTLHVIVQVIELSLTSVKQ